METLVEQRKDSRNTVSWPVSVWIPEANRFFNGRSCNISKTGVFITLPVTAPVRTGHTVELNFPRTEALAKEKGQFLSEWTARICSKVLRLGLVSPFGRYKFFSHKGRDCGELWLSEKRGNGRAETDDQEESSVFFLQSSSAVMPKEHSTEKSKNIICRVNPFDIRHSLFDIRYFLSSPTNSPIL